MVKRVFSKFLTLVYIFTIGFMPAFLLLKANIAHADNPPVFISKLGSQPLTTDQLVDPTGLTSGPNDHLYVVDSGQNIVRETTMSGVYVTQWGSTGSGNGQFNNARGIITDSSGNVYVVDTGNHRIQKFDEHGAYLTQWGSEGSEEGQFNYPFGIAISDTSEVYVTDMGNNRIEVFDTSGAFLRAWGSGGSGNGEFSSPQGIAVYNGGLMGEIVYVADTNNSRIQNLNDIGGYREQWVVSFPSWITLGHANGVHVTSSAMNTFSKYTPLSGYCGAAGACPYGTYGTGDGQFSTPGGIASGPNFMVYVADSGNHRIQQFRSRTTEQIAYQAQWGGVPYSNSDQLNQSQLVDTDADGNVYIVDYVGNENVIKKYNSSGAFVTAWGQGDGLSVSNIAVDSTNKIYLANYDTGTIKVYTASGSFITEWGVFESLINMAIDSNDVVYVVDAELGSVSRYSVVGDYIDQWVPSGVYIDSLRITTDSNNDVYLADDYTAIVQKYTSTGALINQFGSYGVDDGQFNSIYSIVTDAEDNLYVADTSINRIQKFDSQGNYILQWGEYGAEDGKFGGTAIGLAIDINGQIYATDYYNHRVQKFGYEATPPPVVPPSNNGTGASVVPISTVKKTNPSIALATAEPEVTGSTTSEIILNQYPDFFDSIGKDVFNLNVGDIISFCIHSTKSGVSCSKTSINHHTATIKSINLTDPNNPVVVITIASTPKDYTLNVRAPKLIDVDSDGTDDVIVSLMGATSNKVTLNFRAIVAEIPGAPLESIVKEKTASSRLPLFAAGLVLVSVITYFYIQRKHKQKL